MRKIIIIALMALMVLIVPAFAVQLQPSTNFKVDIIDFRGIRPGSNSCNDLVGMSWYVTERGSACAKVRVTNIGASGTMYVETGIYKSSTLDDWGIPWFSSVYVPNCESYQTNVRTKKITLSAGHSEVVEFVIKKIPEQPLFCLWNCNEYNVYAGSYKNCWASGVDTGSTDTVRKKVEVKGRVIDYTKPNCEDGIKNQGETSTDCGGVCSPCMDGYGCNDNEDCESTWCDNGVCGKYAGDDPERDTGKSKTELWLDELKYKYGFDKVIDYFKDLGYVGLFGIVVVLFGLAVLSYIMPKPLLNDIYRFARAVIVKVVSILADIARAMIKVISDLIRNLIQVIRQVIRI